MSSPLLPHEVSLKSSEFRVRGGGLYFGLATYPQCDLVFPFLGPFPQL